MCVASIASTVGVSWFLLQAFCSIVDLERGVWELLYCTVLYVICSLFLAFPNYGFKHQPHWGVGYVLAAKKRQGVVFYYLACFTACPFAGVGGVEYCV